MSNKEKTGFEQKLESIEVIPWVRQSQDPKEGITLENVRGRCVFKGIEAVTWFLTKMQLNRDESVVWCRHLQKLGILKPLIPSKFKDKENYYYWHTRFPLVTKKLSLEPRPDVHLSTSLVFDVRCKLSSVDSF
eukprot:TRINITY_DN12563_c0_g1_i4.p1 TRINITY_DN12563_c0_g1~~TRINITY_DN12563_c0_g1_i4.p1  ORF type:complete len:133 (-),score=12.80 TRINITY_DN12563_c0_g1_i4:473-871(-)